jgi:hypothetical protein
MRLPVFTAIVVAAAVLGIIVVDRLPPQDSPFATFDPHRPIGWATAWQLARLKGDPGGCRALLERAGLRVEPISDSREGAFCGFRGAVAVERSNIPWSQAPLQLSCPMAAAIALWERRIVMPAAEQDLGSKVTRIDHYGTYACRRVAGTSSGRPSQHATANAIDVAAFRLADGRRIAVRTHWRQGNAEAAFLDAVRDGSCRIFAAVLGPDFNDAHADHFHLDMGPYTICR